MKKQALVALITLALLASPLGAAADGPAAPNRIVERWNGTLHVYWAHDWTAESPQLLMQTGVRYFRQESRFHLEVDTQGNVIGTVRHTLKLWALQQDTGLCWTGPQIEYDASGCWHTETIVQPVALTQVRGKRYLDSKKQPAMDLTPIAEGSYPWATHIYAGAKLARSGGVAVVDMDQNWGKMSGEFPLNWIIKTYDDGRAPIARPVPHDRSGTQQGRDRYEETGHLVGTVEAPTVQLDKELLEQSFFLDQVPVNDRFDANVDWSSPDGGWLLWQLGDVPEEVGPSKASSIPKNVDVGAQGVGKKQLTAQARSTLAQKSQPETTQVQVAPPPVSAGSPANVQALKRGQTIAYSWKFIWPEPAFQAKIKRVPDWLPFFGGKPLGINETQMEVKTDVLSTGDGSNEGYAQTGLEAMGGYILGGINVKGTAQMTAKGPTFESNYGIKLGGKVEKEEPLLKAILPLLPVLEFIERICTVCGKVIRERAKAKAEISVKGSASLVVKDDGTGPKFDRSEFSFEPELEARVIIDLIKDVLDASLGSNGSANIIVQVPAPYLKEAGTAFKLFGRVNVLSWESSFEKTWEYKANALNNGPESAPASLQPMQPDEPLWKVMDRSYMAAPNYALWTGNITPTNGVDDRQLIYNVFPQANPALAAARGTRLMVWSHDKPGSDALSGQEIMYSWTTADGPGCPNCATHWKTMKAVTNDNVADLTPQLALINDSNAVAVWQRFDSATPGDFNTDPLGYLSHVQIGASKWNRNGDTWYPARQLSVSGSMNSRPQVGALTDGALAVWIGNPANVLMGDAQAPDRIQFARYTLGNNTWATATTMISNVTGLLDMSLATNGNKAALIYARDTDSNLDTTNDRELFYTRWLSNSWSAPTQLTANTANDERPQLALDANGNPLLVWRQDGALKFLAGDWAAAPIDLVLSSADARSDLGNLTMTRASDGNLLLTWQEIHTEGTSLGYAVYDTAAGKWGEARSYTPPADPSSPANSIPMLAHASAVLHPTGLANTPTKDRLLLAYQLAQAVDVTSSLHSLRVADVPLGVNLSIAREDLSASPEVAQAGEPVTVTAIVRNMGAFAAGGVVAQLKTWQAANPLDPGTIIVTQTLPLLSAGSAITLSFAATSPNTGGLVWAVCLDGGPTEPDCTPLHTLRETNEQDNLATLDVAMRIRPLPTHYAGDGIHISALMTRGGPIYLSGYSTATLRLDSETGPLIGVADVVFPISPTNEITAMAMLTIGQVGLGQHLVYWNIDPNNRHGGLDAGGADTAGQSMAVHVAVLPDLVARAEFIGFGRAPGPSAPFAMTLENRGNAHSRGGQVTVYDTNPSSTNAKVLLKLNLPDVAPGAQAELAGALNLAGTPAQSAGLTSVYVQVDAENVVAELNENNNLAWVTPSEAGAGGSITATHHIHLPLVAR